MACWANFGLDVGCALVGQCQTLIEEEKMLKAQADSSVVVFKGEDAVLLLHADVLVSRSKRVDWGGRAELEKKIRKLVLQKK